MEREEIMQWAWKRADELEPELQYISHRIFGNPEPAWQEFKSAELLEETVKKRGFAR